MKPIFKIVLFMVLLMPCALLNAQVIKPLKIGDKVPEIYFAKMLNHSEPSGKLSDFKGKAIIIDLWFKECIPCVSSMKHLDSLQTEFANNLQVLPVTWQAKTDIEMFWRTNLNVKGLKFTQVVEDSIIRKLFPAVSFPHQIWINKSGIVVAITDGKNISHQNIQKLINDKSLGLIEKKDELDLFVSHAINPDITTRYEENKNKLLYYSYFSSYRKEFAGLTRSNADTTNHKVRVTANNKSLVSLYDFAYTNNTFGTCHDRTRIIRKDHNPVKSSLEGKFDSTRLFCYDLIYKGTTSNDFGKYMITDLDRFFGVKSREEIMDIPCYVISPNGKGVRFRYPIVKDGGGQVQNRNLKINLPLRVNKAAPYALERNLNQQSLDLVLFEMGKELQINFEVKWNLDDLKMMNKELESFDLKIEETKRKRKVIILEDAE